MAQISECPSCGKKGLVQRASDQFQCLNCNFSRDLSRTERRNDVPWVLFVAIMIAAFLKILQVFDSPYDRPSYEGTNSRGDEISRSVDF